MIDFRVSSYGAKVMPETKLLATSPRIFEATIVWIRLNFRVIIHWGC